MNCVERKVIGAELNLAGDGDGRVDAVDLQKFLSTFNANFSLQELEAFINDQACHPNGVR